MREAPGCSLRVDHHPTDGVEVERALGRLAFTDCGEELDRLANVSQRLPTAWLVEDAFKLRCERGGVCREQDFATSRDGGYTRGKVDRRSEVVVIALPPARGAGRRG